MSLVDWILDSIFDEAWVGKRGEKLTERELNLVSLFGRKGRILKNVYLPKENSETSEVDVIYITQKGIFVFESKNYSGWIFGDEKGKSWTASLPNGQKNQFYNPIMQNRTHLKWMRKFVGEDVPLFSIIVFSERCELKKVTVVSENVKVIKRDRTYATVRSIWDKNPDAVSDDKINELYEKLKELTNVDAAVKAAHIKNIEEKYKSPDAATEKAKETEAANKAEKTAEEVTVKRTPQETEKPDAAESPVEKKICPRCGSELVLRTAKKGENAGNQFWGCSAFPKCRYVENIK
jgi:hypothetical protein